MKLIEELVAYGSLVRVCDALVGNGVGVFSIGDGLAALQPSVVARYASYDLEQPSLHRSSTFEFLETPVDHDENLLNCIL